jgi:hypothetical protein
MAKSKGSPWIILAVIGIGVIALLVYIRVRIFGGDPPPHYESFHDYDF